MRRASRGEHGSCIRPAADWSRLMARAQAGDREAYRELLAAITPYLRALARRHLALANDIEDTVQDILLTVHRVRHTYDPGRPLGPWLVAIARRRIIDRLRQHGTRGALEVPLAPEHETSAGDDTNHPTVDWDVRELNEAIEALPMGQKIAIRLLKLRELSLKEAAAMTGMSVPALKVATHRAIKTLRLRLAGRG